MKSAEKIVIMLVHVYVPDTSASWRSVTYFFY